MSIRTALTATWIMLLALAAPVSAQTPVLRAAVQEVGTVNWELDTIRHYGLDTAQGFTLDVQGMAGADAAQIAFQGGGADVIVADWIWVARQNAAGADFIFIPYSRAVGGLLVPAASQAQTLADLAGGRIGIAGGALDKSWIILRAYASQTFGMDLAATTEQVFGAPPLILNAGVTGQVDAAINVWHFLARMQAEGMRELIAVDTAAAALGLDPDTPLLGYVLRADLLREQPALVAGLAQASRDAKDLLARDATAWDRLRDRMNAPDDAGFAALQAGFLAGVPTPGPVDGVAAGRMLRLMADLGGAELVGAALADAALADPDYAVPDAMFYTLPQ